MNNQQQKPKARFNLDDYENVKARKKKFYEDYPEGRIIAECLKADDETAQFKASLFQNAEEQAKNLPLATGYAQEFKGQGSYANQHSWLENCEESAVGRALDNAGYSGNNKASKEEIKKVLAAEDSKKTPLSITKPASGKPSKILPKSSTAKANNSFAEIPDFNTYVIPFGPYRGKTFPQIGIFETEAYCEKVLQQADASKKKITGQVRQFLNVAAEYVRSQEPR